MSRCPPFGHRPILGSFLLALAICSSPARGELPPTLSQIESAIEDSSAGWVAGSNPVWNLPTWAQKDLRLGCLFPSTPPRVGTELPDGLRDDLPTSFDWRNVDGVSYVSSVKDQDGCGSCWAFAGCAAFESLRKIQGYSSCSIENLSEQFLVSCDANNLGCSGGYPDRTANFLRDHGTVDESCFAYTSKDSAGGTPCTDRCSDWSSRVRKISSWSYVRNSWFAANPGALDSLKSAVYKAPLWTTMLVYADFFAYKSGVYRHVIGPYRGGHAICLVGWDDTRSCFICKNSWGTGWGENGYFRIAYSQVFNLVRFGAFTISYGLGSAGHASGFRYGGVLADYDWIPAYDRIPLQNEMVLDAELPFEVKYFCATGAGYSLSDNGWLAMQQAPPDSAWPDHYPIASPEGPPAMIAPLWTDLNPDGAPPTGGVFTRDTGDGRFVIEYREIPRMSQPDRLETFEVVLFDPVLHPTRTGDSKILFQYQTHDPGSVDHTVGIESHNELCGTQMSYNGEGLQIEPQTAISFTPIAIGDEHDPQPPVDFAIRHEEPHLRLSWTNPLHDVEGYELLYIDQVVVTRDGEPIAVLIGEPGEAMEHSWREAEPGLHTYGVYAQTGDRAGAPAEEVFDFPPRLDVAGHDVGNVRFSVTDRGTCGFLDGNGTEGYGFRFGAGGDGLLYIGSLWVGTDPLYCLNRDYLADPYEDWLVARGFGDAEQEISDQDFASEYDDGGHPYARGLRVRQDSYAWAEPPDDDFVILRYTLTNEGEEPISGLYVGQFLDWDIPLDQAWENQGGTNPEWRLVSMWRDETHPHAGVALLDSLPGEQAPAANLTLIHNPTWIYPNAHILDADRMLFLSASDPDHSVPQTWEANDWSALASAGPYDLAPGEAIEVSFAVAGGIDAADLLANVIRAHLKHGFVPQGVEEQAGGPWRLELAAAGPNPFQSATSLRFVLPERSEAKLAVFDVSGRLVRTLARGVRAAGPHAVGWDGSDGARHPVSAGIYFARLSAGGQTRVCTIVRLR